MNSELNENTKNQTDQKENIIINSNDWLCRKCLNKITSDNSRFLFEGKSEFSFINPAGESFRIITFTEAIGTISNGVPTDEFTWFPNYEWTVCLCNRCGSQLGWIYSGINSFYGFIKSQLIKALTIMN